MGVLLLSLQACASVEPEWKFQDPKQDEVPYHSPKSVLENDEVYPDELKPIPKKKKHKNKTLPPKKQVGDEPTASLNGIPYQSSNNDYDELDYE
jgi:hypothetical protein